MKPTPPGETLIVIGSGPSSTFLLHRIEKDWEDFKGIIGKLIVLEKSPISGTGMPYSPLTTDIYNMSNISSEEIPPLPKTLVEWLKAQDPAMLGQLGVGTTEITKQGIYTRLALGHFLRDQYLTTLRRLKEKGLDVEERAGFKVADIRPRKGKSGFHVHRDNGEQITCDKVVISTGHYWNENDKPERGFYSSPWPIRKLLPKEEENYNFRIGTLGASLSAFDVVSSLAHRHGHFAVENGLLSYHPHPGTEGFKVIMHSAEGMLPYIQFEQDEPMREIYRHVSPEKMQALVDPSGFLRLATYFDKVCRPLFIPAFIDDGMPDIAASLSDPEFGLPKLAARLSQAHQYRDAFEGMKFELSEAEEAVRQGRVTHWKELLDDLMYTLNFHAHLLPAEDHTVLRSEVLPFVMTVIAAMPLKSARTVLALHAAGKLEIIPGKATVLDQSSEHREVEVEVDDEGEISRHFYGMFIDCSGQKALALEDFPFPGLVASGSVSEAVVRYADPLKAKEGDEEKERHVEVAGHVSLKPGGIAVDSAYRLLGREGTPVAGAWDMAFPHMTGLRPYSYGLQACDETAKLLLEGMLRD